jgi:hypothetical protein
MIAIYVRRINNRSMTIDEVPTKWKDAVETELGI